jgi:hypothetical protein
MKRCILLMAFYSVTFAGIVPVPCAAQTGGRYKGPDFDLTAASVTYVVDLDLLIFEQQVAGTAGRTTPAAKGDLDGAPVLGYVFPTSLKPEDVGFSPTEGVLALAVAAHPDFDDTPLWDENNDGNYGNDGVRWHTHWVVLVKDSRVPGGLSVKEFRKADGVVLPPTNPGMAMYMDSPGYSVLSRGNTLRVLVPAQRVKDRTDFKFDAVTAYMEVSAPKGGHKPGHEKPMLGVYDVFEVLSGDLSLPYTVTKK